jgi:hypothetical protein
MTGEHLSPDIQLLVRLFAEHRVRYLLVGGEAVIHHGYARLTGDVDFFYDRTHANARRLFAALRVFWDGDVPSVASPEELAEADIVVQFGRPPNRVDLLSSLGTVEFASAWRRRVRETIRIGRLRVALPIIGLADLLQSKRDAARHKDLDDIAHLSRRERKRGARR